MKELTHHSWVKSHRHRLRCSLRCSACRGPTIKMYALLLWAATLIGLSGGYFRPPARLSSLHCMLYVTFCLCIWGAWLCFCHDSSQVFAPFHSFLFFQPCLPRRLHPSRRSHRHQCIPRGSGYGNRRGHYMQFWCTYCGLRFHPRPLFCFRACKCCMYVRSGAQQSNPMCTNASGGWPQPCFGHPPQHTPWCGVWVAMFPARHCSVTIGNDHSGSNTRHKKVRVGETNNKCSTQCVLRTLYTCAASKGGT